MSDAFHSQPPEASHLPDKALSALEEEVASQIVDAALKVHRTLGPGLLESVYEACLRHELERRGYAVQSQITYPIHYEAITLETALRVDLLVQDLAIVELKAVEQVLPVHQAQLLTYMKLAHKRLGLLLNFNVPLMRDGIFRKVL